MISAMALTVPTFNDIRTWILDIEATKNQARHREPKVAEPTSTRQQRNLGAHN